MYNVPEHLLPRVIRQQLTVVAKATQFVPNPAPHTCYQVLPGGFCAVPRAFGLKQFGTPSHDLRAEGVSMDLQFRGRLRPYQDLAVNTYMNNVRNKNMHEQQLVLSCGLGKTVIGISIAIKLRRRTAVLVHKDFLAEQWRERIRTFAPSATVGIVRRDQCETTCDFVLIMIQTLVSGRYKPSRFSKIGFLICDESHHIAAQSFVKSMQYFAARYRLSLTATPERNDGLTKIVNWHLGPRTVQILRAATTNNVTVNVVDFNSRNCVLKRRYDGVILLPSLITDLCRDPERNAIILQCINNLLSEPSRNILVLTDRRDHVEFLEKNIRSLPNYSGGVGQYVGTSSVKKKKARALVAENCRTIVSTFSMASEGLDIPRLNTLVLATPKKSVTQCLGRVMRSSKKSSTVIIVDVCDNGYCILDRIAQCRLRLYRAKGYSVSHRVPQVVEDL